MFAKIFGNVSKESIKRQKTCFRFTINTIDAIGKLQLIQLIQSVNCN